MKTQLEDLKLQQADLETNLEYLIIAGLEETELYKRELDKLHTVKSIIYNIR